MVHLPLSMGLLVAFILFLLGLVGVLVRRNLLYMLISVEIMINAVALAFVVAAAHWGEADGQVMVLFLLAMAAAEVSVGLALILQMHRKHKTIDVNVLKELRD